MSLTRRDGKIGGDASVGFLEERPALFLRFGTGLDAGIVAHSIEITIAKRKAMTRLAASVEAACALESKRIIVYESEFHRLTYA